MGRREYLTNENLEIVLEKIINFAKEKNLEMIECSEIFIENSIQFGNLEKFFKTIESLKEKPKTIFISKEYGREEDNCKLERFKKYKDQLAQIKVCVQSDNSRYIFLNYTPWSLEMINWNDRELFAMVESEDDNQKEAKATIQYNEKLEKELSAYLDELITINPASIYDMGYGFEWKLDSMISEKYGHTYAVREREIRTKFVKDSVNKKLNELIEKEKQLIKPSVIKIIEWAKENMIKKLTNVSLKQAMSELEINLTKHTADIIKNEANLKINKKHE